MKKRILSILLALCMVFCLVPTNVFADGVYKAGDEHLRYALNDTSYNVFRLINNIIITQPLEITREVILDLNGYMLTKYDSGSVFVIKDGGHLTLTDSNSTATTYKFKDNGTGLWVLDSDGDKTVHGGVIYGGTGTAMYYYTYGGGVLIEDGGQFTMNGGSIVGCSADSGGGVKVECGDANGTFTMNGGAIIGCVAPYGGGVETDSGGEGEYGIFAMNGGVIDSCVAADGRGGGVYASGPFTMGKDAAITNCKATEEGSGVFLGSSTSPHTLNGTITSEDANDGDYIFANNAQVTIGANANIHANITLAGGTIEMNANATFTGTAIVNGGSMYTPVATANDFTTALNNTSVSTIRLTDDVDIGSSLTILHKLTLDLNGHVLKMTGSGSVIILDDNNGMTTGNLTLIDSNPTAEHKFKVNGVEPWVPDDSGTETVYGGIITGGNAENGGGVYVKKGGKFTMTAGNIVGCTAKYGGGLYLKESSFTMIGGSIVGCSSTMRAAGEPLYSGIFSTGTNNNVYTENPNVITLTGGLIKNNGRFAIYALYNTIIYANGGEIYGKVDVYQACKITGLAGKTGVTAFRGWTEVKGASNIPENISHVDWGLFYGGLGISGDTTTGIIVTYKDGDNEYAKQALPSAGLATCPDALGDKTGYTFGGWERADGTAWDFTKDTVTENITLYAKWIPHTYTVTFDSTGGSEVTTKTMTATYGKPLANMPVPRREGYVFLGWYDAMMGGKCYGDSDGNGTDAYDEDGNITLYAQWMEAPSRMVYFNTCGGTMTGPTEVLHKTNTPIARPSDPTKPGYTFTGWYTDSAFTQVWNFDDWVTGELRLYAGWTVNQYTITIKRENGEADIIIKQDFGTAVTAPNLTKTGYTFDGWDKTFPTTMPAEDITITAQWKINQYTIIFDTDGGSKIDAIVQDYGTAITAPANPKRNGYTFKCWDKVIPKTMPAENITIKAQWTDIEKPTGEISVSTSKWKIFLNNITFGLFFKNTQTVTITAADNSGEAVKIEYLLSAKELTAAELANASFTAYTAPFGIDPNNEYIVYARLTDTAGNVSYICSDGIVLDSVNPVISGVENGKIYCAAQTVTVTEKYADTVTVNGTAVTLDKNGSFVLNSANNKQKIVVTDKAGNTAEMTVTVNNGHTFGEWVSNGGTHTHKCTVDGCNGTETKDCYGGTATCTERAICEGCGKAYGETDAKHHPTLAHTPAKQATADAEGNNEYWHCGDCGKYFSDEAAENELDAKDITVPKLQNTANPEPTKHNGGVAAGIALALAGAGAATGAVLFIRKKKKR